MQFYLDGKGQQCVRWHLGGDAWKMAWIQDRSGDPDKDWAGTGRYLNVVRAVAEKQGPAGNATDFPISAEMKNLSDVQILTSFVLATSAVTGFPIDMSKFAEA
ncbi:hypothetical protein MYG64_07370 [Ensifer adhaerens]|uniref:hypothetical protein n=1 Tax=Ensifer adhaerens TaxID=106592 RepID=UPI0021016E40|nr:hypothetical protein [Ensifer adhaerens]UTV38105.1 hypothetical protein MYG64_07370 [Ensifer adhaerens]